MEMTKIKICGLSREADISYVNEAKPDYCGFIINFPKSIRNVTPDRVRELVRNLSPEICPVGVFVNQPLEVIVPLVADGSIRAVQLHGSETAEFVRELRAAIEGAGKKTRIPEADQHPKERDFAEERPEREERIPVLQAFKIASEEDVRRAQASEADYILMDRGTGTGQTFDWDLIGEMNRPFFLAGGLGPENIKEAIDRFHPYAVDMSSSVETEGIKDRRKIMAAVTAVRNR